MRNNEQDPLGVIYLAEDDSRETDRVDLRLRRVKAPRPIHGEFGDINNSEPVPNKESNNSLVRSIGEGMGQENEQ